MRTKISVRSFALPTLLVAAPLGLSAQSVLVEAKTTAGDEVATIRTDSMRLLVPLHLLVGGLLFPDGTLQTTAAADATSVTSAQIVDGTIVDADISASAAIADTKLGTISAAGKVANSATTATSASTPGAIVARDATGGFAAAFVQVGDSLRVRGEGSFLATGTYYDEGLLPPPPASGEGARMMWYPAKAAFRAGYATDTQWDGDNIGWFSFAAGVATTASETGSTALGQYTTASGANSTALGNGTIASGIASTAFGSTTTASGDHSTAFGFLTTASGNLSVSSGRQTIASGQLATAFGLGTTAQAYGSVVIGSYNVVEGIPNSWIETEPLFVAGNGLTAYSRTNALTLYKNGNLTIAGTLTQSSDARLKEGIEPLEGTLHRVLQLTPIRYHFRAGTGRPQGTQLGLTAQQVQPLFPELVKEDGDGYLSLSYANLSAVLVKAVQEQDAEMSALQREIRSLKAENEKLQASDQSAEAELASLRQRNERLESELRAARESGEARVARLERLVEQLLSTRSTAPAPTLPDAPR
ncbi:MAG: tail fiber domain-containing protein [Gemmatimonadota bacterium]|jgi:autotransporter adhesin